MAVTLLALVALLAPPAQAPASEAPAAAAPASEAPPPEAPASEAPAELVPPKVLGDTSIPYPAGAPPIDTPDGRLTVTVKLRVGPDGAVRTVERLSPPQPVFDEAVLSAVQAFRFEPGTYGGKPVTVDITYVHTFVTPPPPPPVEPAPEVGPPLDAVLRGRLREMGTGLPLAQATVHAEIAGRHYETDTDAQGRFRLPVPAGQARITVHAANHLPFLQSETLEAKQELAVTYLVERDRYDPYEIVVAGEQQRQEVSRISLRGAEIKHIPGTFGDPYRVVATLPGVASIMSLLPYPIIRGASPSSTGFLLDGTRVPLLFHLLSGPSVIHPEFIEDIQFYPGGAPVLYGGYTAGIIDGRTRRARPDESLIDIDLNLLQSGALVREPIETLGGTLTVAGRVGYPGVILSLATDEIYLSYWDYQLRWDGGNPRNGYTIFAFGAKDTLETPSPDADPEDPTPPLEPTLILEFHRLDLRFYQGEGAVDGSERLVLGFDQSVSSGVDVSSLVVEPRFQGRLKAHDTLELVAGLEGSFHRTWQGSRGQTDDDVSLVEFTEDLSQQYVFSGLTEAIWRPSRTWLVRPGFRTDVYWDRSDWATGLDPRLSARYRLVDVTLDGVDPESDQSAIWLKGGVGLYHQPPRFFLPLPGLDTMPLKYGLLQALRTSLGVEVPFEQGFSLNAEVYYDHLDPVVFDLSVNEDTVGTAANETLVPTTTEPDDSRAQETLDRLLEPQKGRAYGLEVLLRRQSRQGVYGWVSYTASRSERERDGEYVVYDFDRTHLLNVVAGIPLPRNWDLSLRLQYQSGKPTTTTSGYNAARIDGYTRVDLRIDKRAVWQSWLLDFYVDVTNVALFPEEVSAGNNLRYVLPTIGLRGRL